MIPISCYIVTEREFSGWFLPKSVSGSLGYVKKRVFTNILVIVTTDICTPIICIVSDPQAASLLLLTLQTIATDPLVVEIFTCKSTPHAVMSFSKAKKLFGGRSDRVWTMSTIDEEGDKPYEDEMPHEDETSHEDSNLNQGDKPDGDDYPHREGGSDEDDSSEEGDKPYGDDKPYNANQRTGFIQSYVDWSVSNLAETASQVIAAALEETKAFEEIEELEDTKELEDTEHLENTEQLKDAEKLKDVEQLKDTERVEDAQQFVDGPMTAGAVEEMPAKVVQSKPCRAPKETYSTLMSEIPLNPNAPSPHKYTIRQLITTIRRENIALPTEEPFPEVPLSDPPPANLADLRNDAKYMAFPRKPPPISTEYAAELLKEQRPKGDLHLIGAPAPFTIHTRNDFIRCQESLVASASASASTNARPLFLRLPPKVHRQILAHLLVSPGQVTPYRYFADPVIAQLVGNTPKPQVSLLQAFVGTACVRALEAARAVLYKQNVFFFREPRDLMFFYGAVGEETCRERLRLGGNVLLSHDFFYS
ncbi:MAG: hypothetical protein Q9187_008543, partial [Circinaria calcarea]